MMPQWLNRMVRGLVVTLAVGLGVLGARLYDVATPDGVDRVDEVGCIVGDPLKGIALSPRLEVLQHCVTATGTVWNIQRAEDGDFTFDLELDAGFEWLINEVNERERRGRLHIEIIPLDQDRVISPRVGERISVTGVWVKDRAHGGHLEIHPVGAIEILD